jgi:hypothetical protein
MPRPLYALLVPMLTLSLGGFAGVPRVVTIDGAGGVTCGPAATGGIVCCATTCGDVTECGTRSSVTPLASADAAAAADPWSDAGICVCCVCGIGVLAPAPELWKPDENPLAYAGWEVSLRSVDREPTSPPPKS